MTSISISDRSSTFNPPELTSELLVKLKDLYRDGGVLSENLEEYIKSNDPQSEVLKHIARFNQVGIELSFFFSSNQQPPVLTPRVWEALKEYFLLGLHLAEQADRYREASLDHTLHASANVTERSFENPVIVDFFFHNPYE